MKAILGRLSELGLRELAKLLTSADTEGLLEIDGPVARLVLNRPKAMNALNLALIAQIEGALPELAANDAVRVLVLTGSGPAFCAGADLKEIPGAPARADSGNSWLFRRRFGQIGARLLDVACVVEP